MGGTLNMQPAKKRRWKRWAIVLLLLAAGGGSTAYYFQNKKAQPVDVQVSKAIRKDLVETVVANGRVQPVVQVKISPEVSGEIIELPVKEGQPVKKGDLLIRIRPDNYAAARRSAEASFRSAEASQSQARATLEKTDIELQRNETLFKDKLIPDTTLLEARTTRKVAKAAYEASSHQVDVAKASLARAEEDLNKTTIVSPITGTVSRLNSQLGERVVGTAMMTGTEVMVVADLTEMEARVEVGEMDVVLMKVGLKSVLEVDAFRDRKFHGLITEVANSSKNLLSGSGSGGGSSQDATRFEVRIRIDEKEYFRPGMSVTAEIETRYRTNALTIPIQCVTTRLQTNAAAAMVTAAYNGSQPAKVSSAGNADNKPRERNRPVEVVFLHQDGVVKSAPVKRGISDDASVEILEGLSENQEVVSGSYRAISRDLSDGSKVRLTKEPASASAAPKP